MIRVGVIGYGTMGRLHSKVYKQLPDTELVMVADLEENRRAAAERALDVRSTADFHEILQDESIDLVDICLPTDLHEQAITEAVAANKHIFCEKPLVRMISQGKKLLKLLQGYDKKVSVGHVVRFSPEYINARESILRGDIGRAAVARTFRGGAHFPQGWQDWYADYGKSGGVILDLTIHDIDFLRWCFGEVVRVYAKSTHFRTTERLEQAMIVLRFASGVIAHVEGSWTNFPGQFYTTLEVSGDSGMISFDTRKTVPIVHSSVKQKSRGEGVAVPESPTLVDPYQAEIADFVDCIINDREPAVSIEDAHRSMEVALAAVESAQTGRVVHL